MSEQEKPCCAFCGLKSDEVTVLFTGKLPDCFICDECVNVAKITLDGWKEGYKAALNKMGVPK